MLFKIVYFCQHIMSEMTLWLIKILSLLFLNDPSVAAAALLLLGTFKNYVGKIGIEEINCFQLSLSKMSKSYHYCFWMLPLLLPLLYFLGHSKTTLSTDMVLGTSKMSISCQHWFWINLCCYWCSTTCYGLSKAVLTIWGDEVFQNFDFWQFCFGKWHCRIFKNIKILST